MKILLATVLILASAGASLASPTKKTYARSCDAVWTAEKIVLQGYNHVVIDEGQRTASFADNSVVVLTTSLSGSGDTCTIEADGGFARSFHKNAENFFKRIDNALAGVK